MLIRKVVLANWKNFQNVDVDLSERVFLVGANASGKSNFLDVIRFLRDVSKQSGGLQYAVQQRGGVSKIRCLAARRKNDISIEVHLSEDEKSKAVDWIYYLSFKNSGGGIFENQASIIEEKVYSRKRRKYILERSSANGNEDSETLKFTHLEQPTTNTEFRELYFFFQEVQYLHIVPQLIRDSDSYLLASNKEDFYGRNLLDRMDKVNKNIQKSYLKRINEVLQLAVPQLSDIEFVKDKKGIPHLEARYTHWRGTAARQREEQFSDGTLRLIGFMWALLDGQETILLEEPELYLHAAIVKQLPEFIFKLQNRKNRVRQVIISTHSYDLLSNEGIGSDETIIFQPSKEGTIVKRASDFEDIKKLLHAGMTMAESVLPKVAPKNIEQILELKNID